MSDFTVLAFMGKSESGKSFCSEWAHENKGFVKAAYADVLKRFCKTVFGFTDQQLWGEPQDRNSFMTPLDGWAQAMHRFTTHVDGWTKELDLTLPERADYKRVLQTWFDQCMDHDESGLISARVALQLLGTDFGRTFKSTLWTHYLLDLVIPLISQGYAYRPEVGILYDTKGDPPPGVVIMDCRFRNELLTCQEHGGYVIKLVRLSRVGKENQAEKAGISGHLSETEMTEIPAHMYDLILELEDGADNVYPALEKVFDRRAWDVLDREGDASAHYYRPGE